jgi:hypothetical protein
MPDNSQTAACHYCGREEWPYCMNSRDMEDAAIGGDNQCFTALEQQGWGEAGERYVRLNRERMANHGR